MKQRKCGTTLRATLVFGLLIAIGLAGTEGYSDEPPGAPADSSVKSRQPDQTSADSLESQFEPSSDTNSLPLKDTAAITPDFGESQPIIDTVIVVPRLDFSGVPLADALRALARAHNLSMFIDPSVSGTLTMRLDNVTLRDAILFIIKEYHLAWERTGGIVKIFKPPAPASPPAPLRVDVQNGLFSADLVNADLAQFVDTVIDLTGRNIIIERPAAGSVTGKVTAMPVDKALRVLLAASGFAVSEVDGVLYVAQANSAAGAPGRGRNLNLTCDSGLITLEAANAALNDVITALTTRCGLSLFVQTALDGTVQASFTGKTPDEALTYLLLNSKFSYSNINGIYFVGSRESQDLYTSRLIRLKHLVAAQVMELIPAALATQVSLKVAREHNGLVATGPNTALARLVDFLTEIDVPTAQVLFDVMVIDFTLSGNSTFQLTANNFGGDSGLQGQVYYPSIEMSGSGESLNDNIASLSRHLGISKPFTLSENFFVRLRWLEAEGKANVRSHPQIAALNGHTASISIGTTQYFLLESKAIYPSGQDNLTQTAQRFETIEADMSLEVTPFVNSENELIVEVKPEFSTPAQQFDPDIPPTINTRVLNSTVRLRNGETIVLGGLVQVDKRASISKLPILGYLPVLGRLFQNRSTIDVKSELMIYITPHVYYGSDGAVDQDSLMEQYR